MPGPVGRAVRDIMLRLIFRYVITEKSLAWMYDYRVDPIGIPPRECDGRAPPV